jgi:tetratricopeptide (TPR) repeat protein
VALGEIERIGHHLCDAETLARALDDQSRLARASCYLANWSWFTGDYNRAVGFGQQALAIGERLGDVALRVRTNHFLSQAYYSLGDYQQSIDFESRNVAVLQSDLIRERFGLTNLPAVSSRIWLVFCLTERGDFAEGIARGEEALGIAEAADNAFSLVSIYHALGHLYLRQGNLDKAIVMLERGLGVVESRRILLLLSPVASILGSAYALRGRVVEALPLLEQAVERVSSMRVNSERSLVLVSGAKFRPRLHLVVTALNKRNRWCVGRAFGPFRTGN